MNDNTWNDIIEILRSNGIIDEYAYNIWFKNLEVQISDTDISINFPSKLTKDKFHKNYLNDIKQSLKDLNIDTPTFTYFINQPFEDESTNNETIDEKNNKNNQTKQQEEIKKKPIPKMNNRELYNEKFDDSFFKYNQIDHLNPRYTFDNFIIGKNNQFCAAAAQRVAHYPGQNFNPLFIYGGYGLGKTHMLQAIASYILDNFPDKIVVYMPVDQFVNEFIYALQNKQMEFFRLKYRKADVLLMDDIQFLEKKDASMEEFFHTFNILHSSQKQMVFTCDKPPKDLKDFEERVRNRMEWGLTVSITQPDFETRVAILNKKAEVEKKHVNQEIIKFIAKNVKSSIRELESALIKVFAYCDIFNFDTRTIKVSSAKEILKDQLKYFDDSRIVQVEDIIRKVGEVFKVSTVDIKSKKRNRSIALARNVAMYLSRELTNTSTTEIGLNFGGKDHTTIIHASNKIKRLIETDEILRATVQSLKKDISS